ncbi:hypothetical protein BDZ45DRAFT_7369 [Acephala macrosclerotiorum]|nr:hypothetical protein BDZ45DRAFT_7369 [Acephala macrosclerotiorum]
MLWEIQSTFGVGAWVLVVIRMLVLPNNSKYPKAPHHLIHSAKVCIVTVMYQVEVAINSSKEASKVRKRSEKMCCNESPKWLADEGALAQAQTIREISYSESHESLPLESRLSAFISARTS